jgi:hypothetical protein
LIRDLRIKNNCLSLNMRKHNGMRPQDIVILLKIISLESSETDWLSNGLAQSVHISPSEVSESLSRSVESGLIDQKKRRVNRQNLLEFIQYGLKYVFPANIGIDAKGIPTAHSHPFMKEFKSGSVYVWPEISGSVRGAGIDPLYPNLVKAIKEDKVLYKLLALVEVIRVGRARELTLAKHELKKMILDGSSN